MRRFFIMFPVIAFIAGCELFPFLDCPFFHPPAGTETGSAKLTPFESEQDLLAYFTAQVRTQNERLFEAVLPGFPDVEFLDLVGGDAGGGELSDAAPPPAAPGTDGDSGESFFSETTTQETGVAEADVVKTDGTYLYIISGQTLRIVQAMPTDALAVVSEVSLEGFGREIYLHDQKVIALTGTFGGYLGGGGGIVVDTGVVADETVVVDRADNEVAADELFAPVFDRPKTIVTVIDVSVPAEPQVLSKTSFDGAQSSSRMIDGVLYLVVSNFQSFYVDVFPMLGRPELVISDVSAETLLPGFEQVDADDNRSAGSVVTWEDLYHPEDPDGFGVVTVISLDVDNGAQFTATGIMAEPGLIYSSREALYLTDTNYSFFGNTRETTDIHKFAYNDRTAALAASGTVPGRILNQYSMGEYQGHLRVATTVGPTFSFDGQGTVSSNNVYVLGQAGDELTVVGSVENIAPRETIQSARFVGDRGYVVTFEQIDPLFTLDLSDPADPQLVGELKVPGFSTFLIPITDDHLLAVGQYVPPPGDFGPWGVQLSIFDVSDFANPVLRHNVIIGQDTGAFSEALHDPKAFTYFAQADLVALPVSVFTDVGLVIDLPPEQDPGADIDDLDPIVPDGFDGLMVFRVSIDDGFSELGRISTRFDDAFFASFTRGVFMADNVFAVTDNGVRGGTVDRVNEPSFELAFPRDTFNGGDIEPIGEPIIEPGSPGARPDGR